VAGSKKFGLELVIGALDNATKPLQDLHNQLNAFQAPLKKLKASFDRLDKASGFKRIRRSFTEVNRAGRNFTRVVGGIGKAFLGIVLLQGAVGLFFQKFILGAAQSANQLKDLSERTGVTIETFQTLGFAAQNVGVTQDQFNNSMDKFTIKMGELKAGSGSLFGILKRIDPQFAKVLQGTDNNEEAMRLFIERMRSLPSVSARAIFATAAFGRSNQSMANLAKLSREELEALENEMRRNGTITEEQATNAAKFNDQLLRTKTAFSQIQNVMAAEFLPTLTGVFKDFTELLIENRPALQEFAKTMVERLPEGIRRVKIALSQVYSAFKQALEVISWLNDRGLTFERVLIALAAVIAFKVVVAVAALAKAVIGLGIAIATTPIGLLIVGLSGLAFAIKQVIDNWEIMVEYFSGLSAKDLFGEAIKALELMMNPAKALLALFQNFPGASNLFGGGGNQTQASSVGAATIPAGPQSITRDANITVKMEQLPAGTQVSVDRDRDLGFDLDLGFVGMGGFSR
jgi:hypothetical protein